MEKREIEETLQKQRAYFETGQTLPVSARKAALRKLYAGIVEKEKRLCAEYESMELSVFTDRRTSDRCHRGGEYGGFKAKRLCALYGGGYDRADR